MNDPQMLLSACCVKGLNTPIMHRKKIDFFFMYLSNTYFHQVLEQKYKEPKQKRHKDRLSVKHTGREAHKQID